MNGKIQMFLIYFMLQLTAIWGVLKVEKYRKTEKSSNRNVLIKNHN